MKRHVAFATLCAALCLTTTGMAKTLRIVTTTSDLAAIAKAVAGDRADVHSICTGKEDPHMLQAKPSTMLRARDADLWIRVGLELEIGWEPTILDGSRNRHIREGSKGHLDASESALILDVPQTAVSRAMGDVHPMGNPHYWLDPLNARRIAGAIADRLALLLPEEAAIFQANAAAFQKLLDERMFGVKLVESTGAATLWAKMQDGSFGAFLDEPANRDMADGWVAAMLPLRDANIVTYHRSWVYFANRFSLKIAGELEPKPGVPPTAAHLDALAESAKAARVKIILQEPFYSIKPANQLAEKIGGAVVVVANSTGGQPEAADYIALIDLIVQRVSDAGK